jgi:hypothetical protein
MRAQFLLVYLHAKVGPLGDDRTLAVMRRNDAVAFELEVSALDGDDADVEFDGELADGR